ncbi:MAG: RimJ/RimL family protein N-acetyltransferase [Candidatus Latescibacterota bacterium]|jgi:RimJ/RimL family protein N-acetyltransferase
MSIPTLKTERLTLRQFTEDDVNEFVDAVFSNPNVMATLPGSSQTPEEQAECALRYIDFLTSPWI